MCLIRESPSEGLASVRRLPPRLLKAGRSQGLLTRQKQKLDTISWAREASTKDRRASRPYRITYVGAVIPSKL
jgi:hypothetical protein